MIQLEFVFFGLSVTSSWGNGHATTYRGLLRELARRGHGVLFLEQDVPYYAAHRDLPNPPYARTELYASREELIDRFSSEVAAADVVIVGSYVPDAVWIADWLRERAPGVRAFYDIDTPVTIEALQAGGAAYLEPRQVAEYVLYLSFSGGPLLLDLQRRFGARRARPLYCSADPEVYFPEPAEPCWDLGYLGTYSQSRQPALDELLLEPARSWPLGHFVVAGPQYPGDLDWPGNVERLSHVAPPDHRSFYSRQHFTLNVTRAEMVRAGYSPSIRLFEAAACATPILSDGWTGLDTFFKPGQEISIVRGRDDVLAALRSLSPDDRRRLGERARRRVLQEHTSAHRAETLEGYLLDLYASRARPPRAARASVQGLSSPGGRS